MNDIGSGHRCDVDPSSFRDDLAKDFRLLSRPLDGVRDSAEYVRERGALGMACAA